MNVTQEQAVDFTAALLDKCLALHLPFWPEDPKRTIEGLIAINLEMAAQLAEEKVTFPAGHGGQFEGYGPVEGYRSGPKLAAAIRALSGTSARIPAHAQSDSAGDARDAALTKTVQAHIEDLSGCVALLRGYGMFDSASKVETAANNLRAALAHAQSDSAGDAKRVNWLEAQQGCQLHQPITMPGTVSERAGWLITDPYGEALGEGKTLREAIDAASAAKGAE